MEIEHMYTWFIKNDILKKPVAEMAKEFENGVSKQNLNIMISDSTSSYAPSIPDSYINTIFSQIDTNKNGSIEKGEISSYLKRNYNISLETAIENGWTIQELTEHIESIDNGDSAEEEINNENTLREGNEKPRTRNKGIVAKLFSFLASLVGANEERVNSVQSAAESGSLGQISASMAADSRMHYFQP